MNEESKELVVDEVYTSNDPKFEKMFKTKTVAAKNIYLIDSHDVDKVNFEGKSISLEESFRDVSTVERTIVMTSESDPYDWRAYRYSYPAHLWKAVPAGASIMYHDNLIWHNTSVNQVRNEIITHSGWSNAPVLEYKYVVYDSGLGRYVNSSSVANDPFRPSAVITQESIL